uniref:Uncharacterized protein n=1 Tax=Knipowitschia caucasica TaxID=637954 RepID=A0AAV2JEY7_KNICA
MHVPGLDQSAVEQSHMSGEGPVQLHGPMGTGSSEAQTHTHSGGQQWTECGVFTGASEATMCTGITTAL